MTMSFWTFVRSVSLGAVCLAANPPVEGASLGDSPTAIFTNLAERLLQSQLGVSLTGIEIYPRNDYLPSVHRLLQVAANLYDASTNSARSAGQLGFPSVFRPLFAGSGSNVFICGYTNDNDAAAARTWFADSPPGIPLVIGAKKGLPNFNEFVFQTAVQFIRKLEIARPATNLPPNQTNQLLLLSISNLFGVETWNSYSRPFSNDFEVFVTNILSLTLSNAADGYATSPPPFLAGVDFPVYASTNTNWYFNLHG